MNNKACSIFHIALFLSHYLYLQKYYWTAIMWWVDVLDTKSGTFSSMYRLISTTSDSVFDAGNVTVLEKWESGKYFEWMFYKYSNLIPNLCQLIQP